MGCVVMTVNCSIYSPSFPMVTVSVRQFQREPEIYKTIVGQNDAKLIDIRAEGKSDNIAELEFGDIAQTINVHHLTHAMAFRRLSS
ncbi:MAG: hypothetical protein CO064_10535 [Anaerolineae bacterium CG_4_9_14_0_8_um_filter_58_9]|nr:MAG: hypothetical protein CO064_10535 [Anaerolineae bacterium CG_4_9_14_0_8_um_filter_58_9]